MRRRSVWLLLCGSITAKAQGGSSREGDKETIRKLVEDVAGASLFSMWSGAKSTCFVAMSLLNAIRQGDAAIEALAKKIDVKWAEKDFGLRDFTVR
jgi:hypothetical protein